MAEPSRWRLAVGCGRSADDSEASPRGASAPGPARARPIRNSDQVALITSLRPADPNGRRGRPRLHAALPADGNLFFSPLSLAAVLSAVPFAVDRPFFFGIRDPETGAILFMGRVLDPTA